MTDAEILAWLVNHGAIERLMITYALQAGSDEAQAVYDRIGELHEHHGLR